MRQITADIYLSFGFLFYFLQGFGDFYAPKSIKWVIPLFLITGLFYLFRDIRDRIKDKLEV